MYKDFPLEKLKAQSPDYIINLSASPFSFTHPGERREVLATASKKYQCPVIYVNQQGGNTDLVFDGGSMVVNPKGNIVEQLPLFSEDIRIIDLQNLDTENKATPLPSHISMIHEALVSGIHDYFTKSGFSKAVLGLSGGIDSAVTAVLACRALGSENVTGILMPSQYSSDHSISDAIALAKNLGMRYEIIAIKDIYNSFEAGLNPHFEGTKPGIAEENIQARVRGTLLMSWSNKFGNILLNTSNKSEMAVGYGTLYGDMCGAISVLGDVYKTTVYELAQFINANQEVIPVNSIVKPPSAELRENQKDSDSLPEYDLLDSILEKYIEQNKSKDEIISEGYDATIVHRIIALVNNNEYKRYQAPPVIRVTSKAFGPGRRMPLVAKF
jgi:NAD+ synthase (glutamine-hydrolysing)